MSALLGGPYDPDELDQRLYEYRAAKRAAVAAWTAWERWERQRAGTLVGVPPETPDPVPHEPPTARLRFARWLVEHGHLSG